MLLVPKHSY